MANPVQAAVQDIIDGVRLAPLWLSLGVEQTLSRFRRTLLGPFWLAAPLLAISFALAFVFGALMGQNYRETFPSIISGILVWSILGQVVAEAAGAFTSSAGAMQTQKLPLSFHIFLLMNRSVINFISQLLTLWAVFLILRMGALPTWQLLLGVPVVVINATLMSLIVAIPATRYRDLQYTIGFFIQILFFVTPLFWVPDQLSGNKRFIVDYNPFAHMLELVRQPLLGRTPALDHWIWSFGSMAVLAVIAIGMLALYRKRVVFWL